ncbi:MAG TPA: energy transducer TonB [Thermoanaerobaculia bacterium]
MFETSVVHVQAQAARGRVGLLTASLMAHSAMIVGAVAMSIATVQFPAEAPHEYSLAPVFTPITVPPPLGTPNGGAKPAAQPKPAPAPVPSSTITAPANVPENVIPVQSTGTGETTLTTGTGTGTEVGPVGVPWGTKDGVGDLDAPPALVEVPIDAEPEAKIYQPYEVNAPVLIRKVAPRYPQLMARVGGTATVVLRCVIDRNGNVRDPEVIVPAMAPFNAAVLDVLPQWRYKPATHGGKPVDSYLELTVTFNMQR